MNRKNLSTVFKFEYLSIVRTKLFLILTAVIIAIIGFVLTLPPLLSSNELPSAPDTSYSDSLLVVDRAGVIDDIDTFSSRLSGYKVDLDNSVTDADIKQLVNDGKYSYVFLIEEPLQTVLFQKRYGIGGIADSVVSSAYDAQYRSYAAAKYNLSDEAKAAVVSEPDIEIYETDKSTMNTYFYTYFLMMLLYMTIVMYGQMVASSVAGEKSSRAMELLITSADPKSLLFGKILGAGCAGLTQITAILLACVGFFALNKGYWADNQIVNAIFNMPTDILLYTVLFFVLGFFSYAALYGALGSTVSRSEDVNIASLPITFLFIFAFFISIMALNAPDSLAVKVFSFIPFFSQMVMFVRICVTTVELWQIIISLVLLALTAVATAILSAKIYRIGTLTYGKTPGFRNIIAMLREDRRAKQTGGKR